MTDRKTEVPDILLTDDEEAFALRAGAQLRDSGNELDAATLSRLNRARQNALDEMPDATRVRAGWWAPAGAMAITATVVAGFWLARDTVDTPPPAVPIAAVDALDFELLLEDENLEMIEDLEFFAWLAGEELEAAG